MFHVKHYSFLVKLTISSHLFNKEAYLRQIFFPNKIPFYSNASTGLAFSFICKKEKKSAFQRETPFQKTLFLFIFYFVKSNYILIGSFDGTPAFLGYFFGVAEIFLIFTRVRSASAPIKEK